MTTQSDPNGAGSVKYDRWNESIINMNMEESLSTTSRLYSRVCIGSSGVAVKAAGAVAALVSIYIVGYTTGYYVHRC